MKTTAWLVSVLVLVGTASLIAQRPTAQARRGSGQQSAEARVFIVNISDTGFQPNVLVLDMQPGQKATIRIKNAGTKPHGLTMEVVGQKFGPSEAIAPGKTVDYEFTAPARGGLGAFYSQVGDDRKHGLQGRLILSGEAAGG